MVVKVLWKFISLVCFRVYLEVNVHKNPTCFSHWSVRVADMYDAMTSTRCYKESFSHGYAMSLLFENVKDGKLNEEVVEVLQQVYGKIQLKNEY